MSEKMERLFTELNQERQMLLNTIQDLSDQQIQQKEVVGEWSIKDMLGHLASWEHLVANFLPERYRTGEYPAILKAIEDEDGWNAQQYRSA